MKGYVAKKGISWYAVIYEGTDPVTGKERRSWHPAGRDRATPSGSLHGSRTSGTEQATKRAH
jgi:hypothetical protein